MKKYLLPQGGNFYKTNLHAHTTISDGKLTPSEMKSLYKEKGYSILAFTDHNTYRYHKDLCDSDFVALAGIEVNIDEYLLSETKPFRVMKTFHVNMLDLNPDEKKNVPLPNFKYQDKQKLNEYLLDMETKGFLNCYNHPYWSLQTAQDYLGLEGLFSMEIYNHGSHLDGFMGYNPQVYDEMLRQNPDKPLFCFATDDNHNVHPQTSEYFDSFGGFVMIKSEELNYTSIVNSLKNGNFYSSTGHIINELYIENLCLKISCEKAKEIGIITAGRKAFFKTCKDGMTSAEFTLDGDEGYFRVVCTDMTGNMSFTNAYKISDYV